MVCVYARVYLFSFTTNLWTSPQDTREMRYHGYRGAQVSLKFLLVLLENRYPGARAAGVSPPPESGGPTPRPHPVAMPNRQKQLLFSVSGLLGASCALSAAVATGLPFWLNGLVLCRTGAELVNATGPELDKFLGELSYGLFGGERVKQCGLGGREARFYCELPSASIITFILTFFFFLFLL